MFCMRQELIPFCWILIISDYSPEVLSNHIKSSSWCWCLSGVQVVQLLQGSWCHFWRFHIFQPPSGNKSGQKHTNYHLRWWSCRPACQSESDSLRDPDPVDAGPAGLFGLGRLRSALIAINWLLYLASDCLRSLLFSRGLIVASTNVGCSAALASAAQLFLTRFFCCCFFFYPL